MGALYGYFSAERFDNNEVSRKMSIASEYWGRDKSFTFNDNEILIGYNHRYNTPESLFEEQPYKKNEKVIFFNGRVDNRDDLLDETEKIKKEIPDGKVALKCWERFGDKVSENLEGDWVLVVWDKSTGKLKIFRDHHGYSALYYYFSNNIFAFATCIKSLLALDNIPKKPDIIRVTQAITSWHGDGVSSGYENIKRLPPANNLDIDRSFKPVIKRYWFPEAIKPLNFSNENDYYEKFMEEYSRAVKIRLRTVKPVGSQLSGGLDSGSIVALAARFLKDEGKRLTVFTSVPAFETEGLISVTRFGDEGKLAKKMSDFTGNSDWYPVTSSDTDPFEAIKTGIETHDEPFHAGANSYWITDIKKAAESMGLGTLLTGQGGNATVSWPTSGMLSRMSKKSDIFKAKHFFTWQGWRYRILPLYIPEGIKRGLRSKYKGDLPFLNYSAINKDFAIKQRLMEKMKEEDHDPDLSRKMDPSSVRLNIIKPGRSIVGFLHAQSAAWNNLEMRDPTFDKRLMEYCLAVPDKVYVSGGMDRMLLRKTFDGLMPAEVLWNTKRGRQSADLGHRVAKFRKSGFNILNELESSPICREMLDISRMYRVLESVCKEVDNKNNTEAGTILLRGITAGIFLLRF